MFHIRQASCTTASINSSEKVPVFGQLFPTTGMFFSERCPAPWPGVHCTMNEHMDLNPVRCTLHGNIG